MSKKAAIFITLLAAIIAIVGFVAWYLFLSPSSNTGAANPVQDLISKFFPAGSTPGTTQNQNQNQQNNNTGGVDQNTNEPAPLIRQITKAPVAGFIITEDKKDGPSARYQETETGHVYSALLSVIHNTRITNTTIPKVREAFFLTGDLLVSRYLDEDYQTIKSFSGKINPKKSELGTVSEGSFDGKFLRDDIIELTGNPSGTKLLELVVENGGGALITASSDGSKPTRVFTSPLREWLPQWVSDSTLYITTKASARSLGYLYSVNTGTGVQTKILGGIFGLTTNINPKNTTLLYSQSQNGLKLFLHDLKTKNDTELAVSTLPEKCAWDPVNSDIIYCGVPDQLPSGEYPDSWYKGITHFSDSLWSINTKTQEMNAITQFRDVTSDQIDITMPKIDKGSNYVVFINRNDSSLWSIKIK